ncbi:MAG: site-2 protease family protein [Actinobacteria bacterium]|nr:site-2 protease family protein [Actinomycetota bacterium]
MSFLLAFVAFAALVILHEFGHFIAAKAVGMRVERFSLFFPPAILKIRRGETSYEIGAVPLGGFVKITGMNPEEELPPEVLPRAYFRQPVWKRVVTIAAGPAMNVLIAFVLVFVLFAFVGVSVTNRSVGSVDSGAVVSGKLKPGDMIVSIDGAHGGPADLVEKLNRIKCGGGNKDGCIAERAVPVVFQRSGVTQSFSVKPRYDASHKRMRLGITFGAEPETLPIGQAFTTTAERIWFVSKLTVALPARVFDAKKRKEIGSAVGGYESTRRAFNDSAERTIGIIALISLSLALINLFPFLPLDGGHIFWALAEKVVRRPIPTRVLERASIVGIALIVMLFTIGFTNDIDRFRNGGFGP